MVPADDQLGLWAETELIAIAARNNTATERTRLLRAFAYIAKNVPRSKFGWFLVATRFGEPLNF